MKGKQHDINKRKEKREGKLWWRYIKDRTLQEIIEIVCQVFF